MISVFHCTSRILIVQFYSIDYFNGIEALVYNDTQSILFFSFLFSTSPGTDTSISINDDLTNISFYQFYSTFNIIFNYIRYYTRQTSFRFKINTWKVILRVARNFILLPELESTDKWKTMIAVIIPSIHVSNYERILDIDNCPSIKQLQFHLRFCFSKAERSNKSINSFFFQQQQHSSYFEILGISFQICSNQNEMSEKRKNQSGRKREKIRKGVE